MPLLRCSKCGSDSGFIIQTQSGGTLEVPGKLSTDRIRKSVLVTCTYCNKSWDYVPLSVHDKRLDDLTQKTVQL